MSADPQPSRSDPAATAPAPEATPDEALMRAACRGDRAAFASLVTRHQAELYAWFRRLGADRHTAEDCVQETFLRLLRSQATWSPRAPFRGFLLVLARNTFVDSCRRRRARPALALSAEDTAAGRESALLIEPAALPFEHEPQDVRQALDVLPPAQRVVVELAVWDGLLQREIAQLLGIPEGTVKSRMHTALARLRVELQRDAIS